MTPCSWPIRPNVVRLTATALLVLGIALGAAAPAGAHSAGGGTDASNYLTRLKDVAPDIDGVRVRVIETGNRLELTNRADRTVYVIGYQGERYLRVDQRGVYQNTRSPATYLNADRRQTQPVPASADPAARPRWARVSSEPVARWHDHRAHWMDDNPPPAVQRDPGRTHTVFEEWTVPFTVGDTRVTATGDLVWIPAPSALPWILGAVALFMTTVLIGRGRRWAPVHAGLVVLLIISDMLHAVGIQWGAEQSMGQRIAQIFGGGLLSVVGWAAGLTGAWALARRRPEGLLGVAVAGLLIALYGGVVDAGDLTRSQIPFAFPEATARAAVTMAFGLGLGLLVSAMFALRRLPPPEGDDDELPTPELQPA